LAKALQGVAAKLVDLVEEKDPVVSECSRMYLEL
jgi:hypothetical protein